MVSFIKCLFIALLYFDFNFRTVDCNMSWLAKAFQLVIRFSCVNGGIVNHNIDPGDLLSVVHLLLC